MTSRRLARMAQAIRESVSSAILFELKDPRVQDVTVVGVDVAGDLSYQVEIANIPLNVGQFRTLLQVGEVGC